MTSQQSGMGFFKQMFGGSWITQGIWVAAELGIADLLADGPQTAETLAEQTHTHSDALYAYSVLWPALESSRKTPTVVSR
jgi:hypothetical protein